MNSLNKTSSCRPSRLKKTQRYAPKTRIEDITSNFTFQQPQTTSHPLCFFFDGRRLCKHKSGKFIGERLERFPTATLLWASFSCVCPTNTKTQQTKQDEDKTTATLLLTMRNEPMRRPSLIFSYFYLIDDDQSYIFTLQATSFVQYYLTRRRQHQMSRSHNKQNIPFYDWFWLIIIIDFCHSQQQQQQQTMNNE